MPTLQNLKNLPLSFKDARQNVAKNLVTISKEKGYKTAGLLTLALSDYTGKDIPTAEVTEWLNGTKLPSLYHMFKLAKLLEISLDSLFVNITNVKEDKEASSLQSLLENNTIIKNTLSHKEPIMATTTNTSISITKTSKRQMDEVVRARTTSRNYNVLLANKIYTSDMTLSNIATRTGVSTRSLRDYAFYGVSVPAATATKLANVLKTNTRNLGLTLNQETGRYTHVKVTVKK